MKVGDLVVLKGFGPNGSVRDVGLIVRPFARIVKCWEVLIAGHIMVIAQDGLELANASR